MSLFNNFVDFFGVFARRCKMHISQRPIAVILGGGAGTRLFPLTRERSKPAVPIAGKFRLIDIPISNCLNSEIYHSFVLTQFNSGSLNQHISQTFPIPHFLGGFVEVLAATQTADNTQWYQGTADAVRQNLWYILREARFRGIKKILILSGDHLYRMDYRNLLKFHDERNADISVAVLLVPREDVSGFGILQVDQNLEIARFVEKPQDHELIESLRVEGSFADIQIPPERPFLASMGIYVFNIDTLEEILEGTDFNDFGKEILPSVLGQKKMFAFPFNGYWRDIGTIRSYYQANMEMCEPVPDFDFFPENAPFYTNNRYLEPSKICQAKVSHSLIADGVKIESGAIINRSIIGLRVIIQKNVEISESILFGNSRYDKEGDCENSPVMGVGCNSVLRRCIVDKDVCIGCDVHIEGNDDLPDGDYDNYYVREGLIILPRKTIIPHGTKIPPDPT